MTKKEKEQQMYYKEFNVKKVYVKKIITKHNYCFHISNIPMTVCMEDMFWNLGMDKNIYTYIPRDYLEQWYDLVNVLDPNDHFEGHLMPYKSLYEYCSYRITIDPHSSYYVTNLCNSVYYTLVNERFKVPDVDASKLLHNLVRNYARLTGTGIGDIWILLNKALESKYGLDILALKDSDNGLSIPKYMISNPSVTKLVLDAMGELIHVADEENKIPSFGNASDRKGFDIGYEMDENSELELEK